MSKVHLLNDENQEGGLSKDTLLDMFKLSNIVDGVSIKTLRELGGHQGITRSMGININDGLSQEQIIKQGQLYGINIPVQKDFTPIMTLICECLEDTMIRILLVAALASTIIGMIEDPKTGWAEGFTILIAVILITGITTGNNYMKERQFRKLQEKLDEATVQVRRNGQVISIDMKKIVVGDLLLFNIGDCFNVDGIMIEGSQVKIDESSLTGESDELKKVPLDNVPDNEEHKISPFLVSGTKVVDGSGTMLVLAVGEFTCQGQVKKLLQTENPPTPLQTKLESVAEDIGKLGFIVAILTFVTLVVRHIIECSMEKGNCSEGFKVLSTLQSLVQSFMIGVTIVVVAVPEGLPLAVTLTLAFSVNKMKDEQNLVKTLASCEIMGGANNICTDKTGTLTQNKMKVVVLFHQNELLSGLESRQENKPRSSQLLAEAICINSSAFPQRNPVTGELDSTGNKTECALLILADSWGYDYTKYRPSNNIVVQIPFNSSRKKMMTVIQRQESSTLRVFVKGASELILEDCVSYLQPDSSECELNQDEKRKINDRIIEQFARQALRTLAIAYKDIDRPSIVGGQEELKEWILQQGDDFLLKDLTLISIAGIKDPLRPDVTTAIQQCHRSGITVRMVTGDNITTARAIAKECCILDEISHDHPSEYQVMEGKDFRKLVGGLKVIKGPEGEEMNVVGDLYKFRNINNELRVLARASPEDKYILVTGLIQLENVVAVTGDGTNDAPALRKADVGFAMGIAGSDVAKEAADIILLDDNFSSIVTACKWGRNIYNCIRKFIQFQLTVNIVALSMAVLGALVIGQSPLNTIEMLWVNLIMDTFASLALATEPPSMEVLNRAPYARVESIISPQMYRFIVFQSLFQLTCLCFILFIQDGEILLIKDWNTLSQEDRQLYRFSFFFQAFVIMQVFNSIHSRKLDEASLNPFSRASNNPIFWAIQIFTIIVQFLLIQYGGVNFVGVEKLTWEQHVLCLCLGVAELIYGVIIRAIVPISMFRFISIFKEKELDENQMEQTITSKLRRKSSVRMHTSVIGDGKKSIHGQSIGTSLKRSATNQKSLFRRTDSINN